MLFALLGLGFSAAALSGQQSPNAVPGSRAEGVYDLTGLDQIGLFNGSLSLRIPIMSRQVSSHLSYSLQLSYASSAWDSRPHTCPSPVPFGCGADTYPKPTALAGLGWRVSLGALTRAAANPLSGYLPPWVYVSPDGSEHELFATLHEFDPQDAGERAIDPETGNGPLTIFESTMYTHDGSYLRVRCASPSTYGDCTVEFPSGEQHVFHNFGTLAAPEYRITEMRDRFANRVFIGYNPNNTQWTLTDSAAPRSTVLTFDDLSASFPHQQRLLRHIDVPCFSGACPSGGTHARWTFAYETVSVYPPSVFNSSPTLQPVRVLTEVGLPDGTSFAVAPADYSIGLGGAIERLHLPTGGQLEWDWEVVNFPEPYVIPPGYPGGCRTEEPAYGAWTTVFGVRARRTFDAPGLPGSSCHDDPACSEWTYERAAFPNNPSQYLEEQWKVTVRTPLDDKFEHFFSVYPAEDGACGVGYHPPQWGTKLWEYALPYTREFPDPDTNGGQRFLSARIFDCVEGSPNNCTLLRSVYQAWEIDANTITGGGDSSALSNRNRRLRSERIVFEDDPVGGSPAHRLSVYSDFDGLGHYRTAATSGFGQSPNLSAVTTAYNTSPVTWTYPGAGWPYPAGSPWVLETYDRQTITENGISESRRFQFDAGTGFLECKRTLSSSSAAAPLGTRDLLETYEHNGGNLTAESFYGGDGPFDALATTSTCAAGGATRTYRVEHDTLHGARSASRYVKPNGAVMGFDSYHADIDASTGLPNTTYDTAGYPTELAYDAMGRVTGIRPGASLATSERGAKTVITYTGANQGSGGLATTSVQKICPEGVAGCSGNWGKSELTYDGLGRAVKERVLAYDGSWSQRETRYNGLGWKTQVSELGPDGGSPPGWTSFNNYDPFGRPRSIDPPDGSSHRVSFAYTGERLSSRETKVATAISGGETSSTSTEEKDFLGRLRFVTEPNGVVTRYDYDVGGRLARVCMKFNMGTGSCSQERLFEYDRRGLLQREQHPEIGAAGSLGIHYAGYDARGHATQRRVGNPASDGLAFVLDAAERVLRVNELSSGLQVKQFDYDTAGGWSNGKLHMATRWNRYPSLGGLVVSVVETYGYSGIGGRVSDKELLFRTHGSVPATDHEHFWQGYTYDRGGQVTRLDYPRCTGGGSCLTSSEGPLFADVPAEHPERLNAEAIYFAGITSGCSGTPFNYCPDQTLTRGQMAVFLVRAMSGPSYQPPACTGLFNDVPCSHSFARFIEELARRGITSGCGGGAFCPEGLVNKRQMAVFLIAAAFPGTLLPSCQGLFADVPCGTGFGQPHIEEVYRREIMPACGPGLFCPDSPPITRGQMAGYLVRAFGIPNNARADQGLAVGYGYSNGYLRTVADVTIPSAPVTLASDLRYHRNGMVAQVTHGNGVLEQIGGDPFGMARPAHHRTVGTIVGASGASGDWTTGTYQYDGTGNVKAMGASRFAYDALSRLVQGDVVANGSTYTQRLEYDEFGNILWNETTTSGRRNTPTDPGSNHLTGATYNQAGSVATWNEWSHEWDPMQMMKRRVTETTQNWHYVYTADDERYWSHQSLEGSDSRLVDTFVLRDLDGRPLREYRYPFSTWMDYIYRGKTQLARDSAHARPEAIHVDHLGTSRFGSGPRRERLVQPNYYPFGEELTTDTQQPYDRLKFTGHERDTLGTRPVADDLDYMHARFRSPITACFLSVDPVGGEPKSPQSWNRYAYVMGNPLRFIDPTGQYEEDVHLDLTTVLAEAAGFSPDQAAAIGGADQGTDDDPATDPSLAPRPAASSTSPRRGAAPKCGAPSKHQGIPRISVGFCTPSRTRTPTPGLAPVSVTLVRATRPTRPTTTQRRLIAWLRALIAVSYSVRPGWESLLALARHGEESAGW